jgi:hypothetical protein
MRLTLTVLPLPVPMIEPPLGTLLVAAVGLAPLLEPGALAADEAAIALSAITARTQEEHGAAFATPANPKKENHFAVGRHACRRTQLDKGNGFVAP